MAKKLMYGFGDQLVYLIWEMKNERPTLACICTTDDDLSRYVTPDRKSWIHQERGPVFVERVACDHLYGEHDVSIAINLLRKTA